MFHLTRWQIIKLLIRVVFTRDFMAVLRAFFPAKDELQAAPGTVPVPTLKPHRLEYNVITSRMVKFAIAGVVVLAAAGAHATGSVDVMDPITKLGKRLTGGDGIAITGNTIAATGIPAGGVQASVFDAYTSNARLTESQATTTYQTKAAFNNRSTAQAATDAAQDAAIAAKVATSSIVNDLTTGGTTVPLSAEQGKTLKGLAFVDQGTYVTPPNWSNFQMKDSGSVVVNSAGNGDGSLWGLYRSIAPGTEYNSSKYGFVSNINMTAGYGDEPSNWTRYNPFHAGITMSSEGSIQGYDLTAKITGAAPSPSTNAKDISGLQLLLESDVTDSMITNEIRMTRGDSDTGIGTGYPISRGLNIQMIKYDTDETSNFGYDGSGFPGNAGLWLWSPQEPNFAGIAMTGGWKRGVDLSTATISDDAILLSPTQTIGNGTNSYTLAELAAGGEGGTTAFTGLSDVPASYTGAAGKVVQVNAGETALEFGQALKTTSDVTFNDITAGLFQTTTERTSGSVLRNRMGIYMTPTLTYTGSSSQSGLYLGAVFAPNTSNTSAAYGVLALPTFKGPNTTTSLVGNYIRTDLHSTFTGNIANVRGMEIVNPSINGGTGTMGVLTGIYVNDLTIGTTNYGILSNVSSGTGKWNLYLSGTAANYLNGNLQIGSTTPTAGAEKLQVTGNASVSGSLITGSIPSPGAIGGTTPAAITGTTITATGNVAGKTISATIPAATTYGATTTVDLSAGVRPSVTLTGNITTLSLSATAEQVGGYFTLKLIQGGSGGYTVPSTNTGAVCSFIKSDGTVTTTWPTLHTAVGTVDTIVILPTSTTTADCWAMGY